MCQQEARQSARTSSGQAKFTIIFNGKCVQRKKSMKFGTCWHVSMWKSWTMKIENQYYQYCMPLFMGSQQTRSATPPGKPSYWWFFHKPTWTMSGHLQKTLLWLLQPWQTPGNPSNELKGESVAGTLLAETAEPGTSRRNWRGESLEPSGNLAEPSGAAESSGTRRNPAEPGGTRRNPAEPGGTRRKPGGNLAEKQ